MGRIHRLLFANFVFVLAATLCMQRGASIASADDAPAAGPGIGKADEGAGNAESMPTAHRGKKDGLPRLSDEQMNLIQLWETRFETRPQMIVPRKTIEMMFQKYGHKPQVPRGKTARRRFRARKGYEQARLLFALDAQELMKDVIVRDEPEALRNFRSKIHGQYVISYCGSRNCHGKPEAPALRLIREQIRKERTAYTNFFMLHGFRSKTGHMIDRDYPQRSLLAQYGMRRDAAATPHPEATGWRPFYRNSRDPRLQIMVGWVGSLTHPLRARSYGVDYKFAEAVKEDEPARGAGPPGAADKGERESKTSGGVDQP
jgi:hypothetical protein